MRRLFISYSRGNSDGIQSLVGELKSRRQQVWYDQRLLGGQRWWDGILENIRAADIFLFAASPESVASDACERELRYAIALGKPILPLRLCERLNPNLVYAPLRDYQFLDFLRQDRTDLDALCQTLATLRPVPLPKRLPEPPPAPVAYLSSLGDRIDDGSPLDRDAQLALVLDIKLYMKQAREEEREQVRNLLRRFKQRRDLLAATDGEIDAVLEMYTSAGEQPARPEPSASNHKPGRAESPPPSVAVDDVRGSMATLLRRAMRERESWRVDVDEGNYLLLEPGINAGVRAVAKLRDDLKDSKSKAFKSLGWKTSEGSMGKGLAGGAAVYATSGLALLTLMSKTVRDYLMTYTATKTWPAVRSEADVAAVAEELSSALRALSPQATRLAIHRSMETA